LQEYILIGVGAMPFCLLSKTPFLFHLLWISLKSKRINWVPGFFFFQTKENEQQCFFSFIFIFFNVSNWKKRKRKVKYPKPPPMSKCFQQKN
jgi:hypothetical protein